MDPFGYRAPGLITTARTLRSGITHVVQGQSYALREVWTSCGSTMKAHKVLVENRYRDEVSCLRCDKVVSR